MCKLCDAGVPQPHRTSRRDFLKATAATGAAAASLDLFAPRPAAAASSGPPKDTGQPGRRYIIRAGSVMSIDPHVGDFAQADVLVEGKKIVAVGPKLKASDAAVIDATRPHRHAGLHRHAPSPVRDRAPQLPRRRDPAARRHAGRHDQLLPAHPADVRPRVPSEGRLHQRAVRLAQPARWRRHDGARHLADPSLARALGRGDPGHHRLGPPRRLRLFRERRQRGRQPVSGRRAPHQATVVLVRRPARHHDHGRRDLPPGLREGLGDRARARPHGGGAHPVPLRHAPDVRRPRRGQPVRARQPVRPHDRACPIRRGRR